MDLGKTMLGRRHVRPEVWALMHEVQVEGTFPDGTYLVTVHQPISSEDGNLETALYGSFLPIPSKDKFPLEDEAKYAPDMHPGAVVVAKAEDIVLNKGRERAQIKVTNNGDRPIQVGSHYHFIETNKQLAFDRAQAYGKRLDIAAGTAIRFEPGETKTVQLVEIAGNKVIKGGNNLASGKVDASQVEEIIKKLTAAHFTHIAAKAVESSTLKPFSLSREAYSAMFGPTTGDKVRLGSTSLWIQVENDFTVYGDECKFGGGKVLRDGMGQATGRKDSETLDLLITNALILDWSGIIKADIGIKNGLIVGIGKGGNPDTMEGVTESMICGVNTEVLAGEKSIITAGGVDSHIHFICPQILTEALASGITTLIGGGTGPNTGTNATTCTAGATNMKMMLASVDDFPLNIGFTGKGNDSELDGMRDIIKAGAVGLKAHEDWGTTPAAIDAFLKVCDEFDVQATIHTDTLNESGFVEDTIAAFKGRTIHTYHSEGAGGGHAPDIIRVCGEANVLPSSTNPTRPFTSNTLDEHVDMLMVCHHLDKNIPEDVAFAESRIRAETIAAEDVLHDIGAISMISSDSQAMGRCGEVVLRTWKTATKMKDQRGTLKEDTKENDNVRVKRYIAKYTINPAIAHGISHLVGSVEVGKVADLVMWNPAFFGTKPDIIMKSGTIAWAHMGDANASIPTVEPVIGRPMYGSYGGAVHQSSLTFVSEVSMPFVQKYGLHKRLEAVKKCRDVTKKDMKWNSATPEIKVDPESFKVYADGVWCDAAPIDKMPLTQEYFIF